MKKLFSKTYLLTYLIIALYICSRTYILLTPPTEFTEIIYSYMPYAHLWASGVRPYLDQWYEYPPATIPLFYLPHLIDKLTLQSFVHISYLTAYKLQLLLVDLGLFALLWSGLRKIQSNKKLLLISIAYYLIVTAKAHHFIFDTMDITFAAALTLAVTAPIIWKGAAGKTTMWLGYFLAIALKLLNGPLGLPYAILERKKWKQHIFYGGIGFILVWAIPLLLYRSSLQVMLVYHQIRGLQISSTAATIVRMINNFVGSETVIEVYKNYEISGPITNRTLNILDLIFPIALVIFIAISSKIAWGLKQALHNNWRISITLGYILLLMLISKVQSTPFMLWSMPLLALFPYRNLASQLKFLIPSLIIIVTTMNPTPAMPKIIFEISVWIDILRATLFAWLFVAWIFEDRKLRLNAQDA